MKVISKVDTAHFVYPEQLWRRQELAQHVHLIESAEGYDARALSVSLQRVNQPWSVMMPDEAKPHCAERCSCDADRGPSKGD